MMRRKDRQVTDAAKIRDIISRCHCCRLGFCDGDRAYVVPLNFGYREAEGKYTFYFHSAREGRKIDLIARTHLAGFEMDTGYQLHEARTACDYSARFQSVIGSGRVDFVEDIPEKEAALAAIMAHNTGSSQWSFAPERLKAVCVFKLTVEELACKEHL